MSMGIKLIQNLERLARACVLWVVMAMMIVITTFFEMAAILLNRVKDSIWMYWKRSIKR